MDIYSLFMLDKSADSLTILDRCLAKIKKWTFEKVLEKLKKNDKMHGAVNIKSVYEEGRNYIRASASILLDPSARQCYDAYLDCLDSPTTEKIALTRARIVWYNSNKTNSVEFSDTMIKKLEKAKPKAGDRPLRSAEPPAKKQKMTKPICRQCRCEFDFQKSYLVLHCDCSTRCGHNDCMKNFKKRVGGKCPVCRKKLLERHQISKYLFWQHKEKFKFIT